MTYFSELAKVLASSSVSGPHPAPVMRRYPQKSQSDQTLREGMKTVSLALLGRETLPTEKEGRQLWFQHLRLDLRIE